MTSKGYSFHWKISFTPSDPGNFPVWRSWLSANNMGHRLRTPVEGIHKRNLKIWANVADKIFLALPQDLGVGVDFRPCQWRRFPHRASVVRDMGICMATHMMRSHRSSKFWFRRVKSKHNYCLKLYVNCKYITSVAWTFWNTDQFSRFLSNILWVLCFVHLQRKEGPWFGWDD